MSHDPIGEPHSSFSHTPRHDASLRAWPILHEAYPVPQLAFHLDDEHITTLPCAYCGEAVHGSKADGWVHNA